MIKLPEDKRRDIIKFLESNSIKNNFIDLDRNNIIKKFKDLEYDEDDINNILDDLEDEGFIEIDKRTVNIFYPKRYREQIKLSLERFRESPNMASILIIGFVFTFIIINNDVTGHIIDDIVKSGTYTTQSLITGAVFYGTFGSFILGGVTFIIWNHLKRRIKFMKKYKIGIIISSVLISLVILIILFIKIMDLNTTIAAIGLIVAIIGMAIHIYRARETK